MWTFKELREPAECEFFKNGYEINLKHRSGGQLQCTVPASYVISSRAVGCFDRHGRMVGGYIIRDHEPFRCLTAIPDTVSETSAFLRRYNAQEMCESTCIWRSSSLSSTAFSLVVWPKIVTDCVRSRRKFILGVGFDNRMNDVYKMARPIHIYAGISASPELGTMVFLYAYTRSSIILTYLAKFWKRLIVDPLGRRRKR